MGALTGREDLRDGAAAAKEGFTSKSLLPSRACGGDHSIGVGTPRSNRSVLSLGMGCSSPGARGRAGQQAAQELSRQPRNTWEEVNQLFLSLTAFWYLDKSLA